MRRAPLGIWSLGRRIPLGTAVAALLVLAPTAPSAADPQHVQVLKAALKAKPAGGSRTLAILDRGAAVDVLGPAANGYVEARAADGATGFLMASSLTTPKKFQRIAEEDAAASREAGERVAVHGAAKGWDRPTENAFAKGQKLEAEFRLVDEIEQGPFGGKSPAQIEALLRAFADEGGLGEAAVTP